MCVVHMYGYRWLNDHYYILNKEATQIRALFKEYIKVQRQYDAAQNINLKKARNQIHDILRNTTYLGDELHPRIIDDETFYKVQEIMDRRALKNRKANEIEYFKTPIFDTKYHINNKDIKTDDPFERAEYLYSQIKEVKR